MNSSRILSQILINLSVPARPASTLPLSNSAVRVKRCALYNEEKEKQLSRIKRIEKITVNHKGPPEDVILMMNKNLSTPFHCAMQISELLMKRSALALVNGEPWDMHHPLTSDCDLVFLHFRDEEPTLANKTFWRSCSFILGHILETAFRDDIYVELCSFPPPNINSGSFVYDADLSLNDHQLSKSEMNMLSRMGSKLFHDDYCFERLEVDASVAAKMFEDNRFKKSQIPSVAANSKDGNTVTLYKMADHIDISKGPMIATTSLIGRYSVVAVHGINNENLKRVQGLALPSQLYMHHWAFENLQKRAMRLNPAPFPFSGKNLPIGETDDKQALAA